MGLLVQNPRQGLLHVFDVFWKKALAKSGWVLYNKFYEPNMKGLETNGRRK